MHFRPHLNPSGRRSLLARSRGLAELVIGGITFRWAGRAYVGPWMEDAKGLPAEPEVQVEAVTTRPPETAAQPAPEPTPRPRKSPQAAAAKPVPEPAA